ncbi:dentin sialophosphoprotein-like isoform X2 [Argiope bruennichi]|uniref:E3 ubiquitin-protein ligase RNF6 like protein n=2 Tax=Argiope bruennichi TaxID=94029 RepID=A0A8T0FZ62_ARGBR|nr:dentin sialophosphoprotein-like isoform X2 [Argiope bruennichi]KAF8796397.1 E3 ubiquitin-protein ligase RNF6 like protein [Argiope bruennichi]
MATFQDDSTDDEIGVNLQLAERLSINKSDPLASHRSLPNGKTLKQFHNYQRKYREYKSSSSSSSLDTHSDPLVLEGPSSFSHHNKKRQNGDKNIEHFNNSKRTCLGDRLVRSPGWKMNGNDIPEVMHYSSQPPNSSVKNLYPDKTYEDHLNNMSDDDSDFQPRRRMPSKSIPQGAGKSSRTFRGFGPKKLFENQPSGSNGVHLIDSTSDDDSRTVMRNGALKGGRQSPEISDKKRWSRKITKVLDSDSDDLQVDYRSRPVIFSSSSDSEDCRPYEKANTKASSASKKSANPSFPSGNSHESDNRFYTEDDEPLHLRFNKAGSSRQCNSSVPSSSSDYRTKNSVGKSSRIHNKPSNSSYQNFYPISDDIEASFHGRGGSGSRKSHSRSPSSSQTRSLRSHRHSGIRKSPKGISGPRQNQVHPAKQSSSDMFNGDGNNTRRSPNFRSDHFPPVNLSMTSYHPRDGNHSIRSITHPTGPHHRASTRKTLKGRCLNGACSQEHENNLASMYPDIFDAEDSSEVEFFTANSYSDNESNTESLTNLRVNPNPRSQPQSQEALSDNPVNVVSSEDEISVVFTSAPRHRTSDSRRVSRTLGRRYRRGSQGFRSSGQDIVSLSPDPVEQVRQVEEDERFARMLQAQFDAEADPSYVPCRFPSPHPPSHPPPRRPLRYYSSGDDDDESIFDIQGDSPNRVAYDSLSTTPLLRGIHFRLSRYPISSSGSGRPNTRNRRRIADIESHLMNLHSTTFNLFNLDTSEDSYEAFLGLAEINGEVSRGLQRTEINRLPTRKYVIPNGASSSKNTELPHKRAELNKECQVCLNDYVNGDVLRILPCFHEFHTPCIDPWLKINHTCPVCRVIVNLEE